MIMVLNQFFKLHSYLTKITVSEMHINNWLRYWNPSPTHLHPYPLALQHQFKNSHIPGTVTQHTVLLYEQTQRHIKFCGCHKRQV